MSLVVSIYVHHPSDAELLLIELVGCVMWCSELECGNVVAKRKSARIRMSHGYMYCWFYVLSAWLVILYDRHRD